MVEPDSLILEHLRAIRGDVGRLSADMQTVRADISSIRQHILGILTIQEQDHVRIADIEHRLDRIEKRLELAD